jgi:hypothetical protein
VTDWEVAVREKRTSRRFVLTMLFIPLSVILVVTLLAIGGFFNTVCTASGGSLGIACVKTSPTNYECHFTSAPANADFQRIQVELEAGPEDVIGRWGAPIRFDGQSMLAVSDPLPPLAANSSALDIGSNGFGVDDKFLLYPLPGKSLAGLTIFIRQVRTAGYGCGDSSAGAAPLN